MGNFKIITIGELRQSDHCEFTNVSFVLKRTQDVVIIRCCLIGILTYAMWLVMVCGTHEGFVPCVWIIRMWVCLTNTWFFFNFYFIFIFRMGCWCLSSVHCQQVNQMNRETERKPNLRRSLNAVIRSWMNWYHCMIRTSHKSCRSEFATPISQFVSLNQPSQLLQENKP